MIAERAGRTVGSRRVVYSACALLSAAGTLASVAVGQDTFWNAGVTGNWFTPGNWNNGVPIATRDAIVDNGTSNVAAAGGVFRSLLIGSNGAATGTVNVDGPGDLTGLRIWVGGFGAQTGTGIFNIGVGAAANVTVENIFMGTNASSGTMNIRRASNLVVSELMFLGRENNGAAQGAVVSQDGAGSSVRVLGSLFVGRERGSKGYYNLVNGTLFSPVIELGDQGMMGATPASTGRIDVRNNSILSVSNRIDIGSFSGGRGQLFMFGNGTTQNPVIRGLQANGMVAPDATVFVNGSAGELRGNGIFDVKVRYTSDIQPVIGRRVSITFDRDMLRYSDTFNCAPGLTVQNVAAAGDGGATGLGKRTTLTNNMLPNTVYNITWGDGTPARDIGFSGDGAKMANLTVPYSNMGVAAPIESRLRLWGFGQYHRQTSNAGMGFATTAADKQGEIRNLTLFNESDSSVGVDLPNRTVTGRDRNVQTGFAAGEGGFDIGIGGRAAMPLHQDPRMRPLHAGGLTGAGVLMGQLEPGAAFFQHGAFDDWSSNDANARRISRFFGINTDSGRPENGLTGQGAPSESTSAHATRVASVMVGFDPLGIHVDAQSRFEPVGRRVGTGFGFTGAAPGASLISHDYANGFGEVAGLNFLADAGCKIINASFGLGPATGDGSGTLELAVDHWAERNGMIFTKSAGNSGPGPASVTNPGGAYNAIVVGNVEFSGTTAYPTNYDVRLWEIAPSSSRGPVPGTQRSRPDLVAQGTGNLSAFRMEIGVPQADNTLPTVNDPAYSVAGSRGLYSTQGRLNDPASPGAPDESPVTGTSFAAPTVAGVAALMVQRARQAGPLNAAESPLLVKSILQTSADKDPARWGQNTRVTPLAQGSTTTTPLSFQWGAGMLDPRGAINLLNAGAKDRGLNNPVDGDGWSSQTLISDSDGNDFAPGINGHIYRFNNVAAGSPFTATLNWFRHVESDFNAGGNLTVINFMPAAEPLIDLNLSFYKYDAMNNTLALAFSSESVEDNLEHIFIPSIAMTGDYLLAVTYGGMFANRPNLHENYGLSWSFDLVPSPGAVGLLTLAGLYASRRRRA
ncbi:MAG: S8 family peptidase [Phycisphaerales bacterium]